MKKLFPDYHRNSALQPGVVPCRLYGRHKRIPGCSAAAVQAADAHIINTKELLLMRVGCGLVVIRNYFGLPKH